MILFIYFVMQNLHLFICKARQRFISKITLLYFFIFDINKDKNYAIMNIFYFNMEAVCDFEPIDLLNDVKKAMLTLDFSLLTQVLLYYILALPRRY